MNKFERIFDDLPLSVKFAGSCLVIAAMWAVCIAWLMLGAGQSAAEQVAADHLTRQAQYLKTVVLR